MKRSFFLVMLGVVMPVAVARPGFADVGVVETTGAFLVNTTTTSYISTVGTVNPRWAGYDFGTFDVSAGGALALTNFFFENYAYNGGSVPPGGSFNDNWLDNASTATFTLFRDSILLYQAPMRQSGVSGNNRNWDLAASGTSINVLDGLASGTHSLAYTIDWNYNQWTGSAVITGTTQSTSAGVATFAVVPEPSGLVAVVAGASAAAGLAMRRRTRRGPPSADRSSRR